jgi:hypothetical protein
MTVFSFFKQKKSFVENRRATLNEAPLISLARNVQRLFPRLPQCAG